MGSLMITIANLRHSERVLKIGWYMMKLWQRHGLTFISSTMSDCEESQRCCVVVVGDDSLSPVDSQWRIAACKAGRIEAWFCHTLLTAGVQHWTTVLLYAQVWPDISLTICTQSIIIIIIIIIIIFICNVLGGPKWTIFYSSCATFLT